MSFLPLGHPPPSSPPSVVPDPARPVPVPYRGKHWNGSTRHSRLPENWSDIRRFILQRDGFRCRICGSGQRLEVDHIVNGDNHAPSNLQVLCRPCHLKKSSAEGIAAWKAKRRQIVTDFNAPRQERHPGDLS